MDQIECLIENEQIDGDFDLLAAVESRSIIVGWTQIIAECLSILSDRTKMELWEAAVRIIFWATSRSPVYPVPPMAIVARLYWCLENISDEIVNAFDDNLIWTIAIDIKGVQYLSEWDPQRDPEVLVFLEEMRQR
jgi:hypothetical protein